MTPSAGEEAQGAPSLAAAGKAKWGGHFETEAVSYTVKHIPTERHVGKCPQRFDLF